VHEEVRRFWEAHYSANIMRASLVSRHSLDELEAFARTAFSGIANKQLAAPSFAGEPQHAACLHADISKTASCTHPMPHKVKALCASCPHGISGYLQ
jgi:secreted Zn-dependent insulinase-like peptidase